MPNIRSKLHTRFFRRTSAASEAPPPPTSDLDDQEQQQQDEQQEHSHQPSDPIDPAAGPTDRSSASSQLAPDALEDPKHQHQSRDAVKYDDQPPCPETTGRSESLMSSSLVSYPSQTDAPELVLQEPALDDTLAPLPSDSKSGSPTIERRQLVSEINKPSKDGGRKQSLFATADIDVIRALLQDENPHPPGPEKPYLPTTMPSATQPINTGMLHRKIWVKKVGSAATLVVIREDDLVDDVKEAILKKYTNNLGRYYDAPDITLRLMPRDKPGERILNPDEGMCRTLDSFYPGGQTVDEAIIIDVPPKRTPRPSPRGVYAPREPQQVHCHLSSLKFPCLLMQDDRSTTPLKNTPHVPSKTVQTTSHLCLPPNNLLPARQTCPTKAVTRSHNNRMPLTSEQCLSSIPAKFLHSHLRAEHAECTSLTSLAHPPTANTPPLLQSSHLQSLLASTALASTPTPPTNTSNTFPLLHHYPHHQPTPPPSPQ